MTRNFGWTTFGRTEKGREADYADLMKRLEEQKKIPEPKQRQRQQNPNNTPDPVPAQQYVGPSNGFIYVPSIDKSVVDHRLLFGKSYDEAQAEIINTNHNGAKLSILTPYQFKEFLKHLRDSQGRKEQELFHDIVDVKDLYRANWLNARFEKDKGKLSLVSENVLQKGKYVRTRQILTNHLSQDRTPGISLDDWINSNVVDGLPSANIADGNLYYWHSRDGAVAWFVAYSGGAYLNCYWDPSVRGVSLGVFACAEGAVGAKK